MKFLEKMVHNDRVIMYNAGKFANVTNELVAAVNWPKDVDMLSFSFEPFAPAGGYVKHALKNDYVVRYMFAGKTSALKPLGKPLKASPVTVREPRNVGEAAAVTKTTLFKNFPLTGGKTGPAFKKEALSYINSIKSGKVRSILLFKNGRNVGIASMMDGKRLDGKKSSTFTWMWIDKRLPRREYEDARFKITKWVKDTAKEYVGSANFDHRKESQKNDSRFGLKPYRIFFAHKK
jgi:hypothetical protein